jgi:hypothetical protein
MEGKGWTPQGPGPQNFWARTAPDDCGCFKYVLLCSLIFGGSASVDTKKAIKSLAAKRGQGGFTYI